MRVRTIIVVVAALLVLGGTWAFFYAPPWEIANVPPKNDTIVAFGDSLVYGTGATPGNDFVTLLEQRLNTEIVNLGVPGDTSADGLARIDEVLAYDSGTVIIVLGGNDALRRVPLSETRQNIDAIVTQLQESGAVVVLAAVRGNLLSDPYEEMYQDVAREHGAAYVPNILEGILLRPEFTEDQIHPNDAGHEIVAGRMYEVVAPIVGM